MTEKPHGSGYSKGNGANVGGGEGDSTHRAIDVEDVKGMENGERVPRLGVWGVS